MVILLTHRLYSFTFCGLRLIQIGRSEEYFPLFVKVILRDFFREPVGMNAVIKGYLSFTKPTISTC